MSFQAKEAYCLMLYRSKSGREFRIWNSRDAVTPFVVHIDGELFEHVDWAKDERVFDYVPRVGSYVFVDLTIEVAVQLRTKFVERWWNDPETPMAPRYPGQMPETVALKLAETDVAEFGGHAPHMLKVTADWVAGFLAGRRNREID